MPGFSTAVMVNAPPEVVFERATNFREGASYIPAIQSIEILTPGPTGVGTRFKETRVMFGRPASEVMEVALWEPPRRCVLTAESHGASFRSTLEVTPKGSGTQLALHFEATALTLAAKVMGILMSPLMKVSFKACAKDLEAIKAAAEGRPITS